MKTIILFLFAAMLSVQILATPVVIYVTPTGSSDVSVNGLSWGNAVSLSRARNLVNYYNTQTTPVENQIWMKGGTYDLTAVFQINIPIVMYGGFAGTETLLTQRDWANNPTILNQTAAAMVIWGNLEYDVLLDGLILQGGRPASGANGCGQISNGTTLRNCIIRNNKAVTNSGALTAYQVSAATKIVVIENCLIINNESGTAPSALTINVPNSSIINTTISNNLCTTSGVTSAVTGAAIAYNVYNSIINNNYNVSTLAKSLSDNVNKIVNNTAWDFAAVDGTKTSCVLLATSPFVAATSFYGAANGTDKLFAAIESADFRLASNSTCINAGNNSLTTTDKDLAGLARIEGSFIDLGCYESSIATKLAKEVKINSLRVIANEIQLPESAIGKKITVYNPNGELVQSFTAQTLKFALSVKGVFIVKISSDVYKVML